MKLKEFDKVKLNESHSNQHNCDEDKIMEWWNMNQLLEDS